MESRPDRCPGWRHVRFDASAVIVGYVAASLADRGDPAVGEALDRLCELVWAPVGNERAFLHLARDPRSQAAQDWATSVIEQAASSDPGLRDELTALQQQLQQFAPNLTMPRRVVGTTVLVYESEFADRDWNLRIRQLPAWVKAAFVAGPVAFVIGTVLFAIGGGDVVKSHVALVGVVIALTGIVAFMSAFAAGILMVGGLVGDPGPTDGASGTTTPSAPGRRP